MSGVRNSYGHSTRVFGGIVAKKKKQKAPVVYEAQLAAEDDLADASMFLTDLMYAVCPMIDKGKTFELIVEALCLPELTPELAHLYGSLIRATMFDDPKAGTAH
jgi:hypothetical protein